MGNSYTQLKPKTVSVQVLWIYGNKKLLDRRRPDTWR